MVKPLKKLVGILIIIFLVFEANATSQVADILIWNGDTLRLFSNPLASRSDWKELSVIIARELAIEDKRLYPQKYEAEEVEELGSTACNRGYVAEWALRNDSLFLSKIFACHDDLVRLMPAKLFSGCCRDGLHFADWVTEELIVPQGNCILPINIGYQTVYEIEIVLKVNKGMIMDTKSFDNHIVSESFFSKRPNPEELLEFIYGHINWENLPPLETGYKQVSVGIQPDDAGRLQSILSEYTYLIDGNEVITDKNNPFIKEAIRIAQLIPDWDVVYQRGKIRTSGITVIFSKEMKERYSN